MAAKQAVQQSSDRNDARMRSFGLGHGGLTVEPVNTEQGEGESDEPVEQADASSGAVASGETKSDESKGEGEKPKKDKEPDTAVEAAKKEKQEAVERERKLQSRLDRQEHLHQQEVKALYQQFEALKESIHKQSDNGDDGLKAGDLVDKQTVDRMVRDAIAKQAPKQAKSTGLTPEQNRYIQLHPDHEEVIKFGTENNLMNDPGIAAIPTDAVGLYHAIQNKRLMAKLESIEKEHKAELEKALAADRKNKDTRGRVPPTGGTGARKGASSDVGVDELTATERMFKTYFDKHAGGSMKVSQVRR